MFRRIAVLASAALLLSAAPVVADRGGGDPADRVEYVVDEEGLPFDPLDGFEDSERTWGVHKGAGFLIEVPADWNGDLIVWAHGFRGSGTTLTISADEVPLRNYALENGYAWAASSYSKNDYNVSTAVRDTQQLVQLFQREFGKPDLTYLTGASMGGHITAASIEKYPKLYDGAMPVCGVLGDYELFDYFLDFNAAAQQIALGSSTFPVAADYPTTTALDIKAALEAFPGGWPVVLNPDGEALKQLTENRSGGDRPNFDEAWFFWNSFPEFGSGIPGNFLFDLGTGDGTLAGEQIQVLDNSDVFYDTDLVPGPSNPLEVELNSDIVRVERDPNARRSPQSPSPELSGKIKVPVLTMHNLGDLFVPFHMETEYRATVDAAGNGDLLVQRAIRGVGHCGFTQMEYETAFADLAAWVEDGVRPAGDDVGDPAAVAAADFGCAFTDFATPFGHFLATPCP
ncbi:MAG: hypothetical protein HKN41_07890 [Ilumatobacter sp.]|nr:hypothetical protein [Ilumatobacter sp.]